MICHRAMPFQSRQKTNMRKEKQTDRGKHRHGMFFSEEINAVRSVLQTENRKFRKEQNRLCLLKPKL